MKENTRNNMRDKLSGYNQRVFGEKVAKRANQDLQIRLSISRDFPSVFQSYLKDIAFILTSKKKIHVKDKALAASRHMLKGDITAFIDLLIIHSYVNDATRLSNDLEDWGELYIEKMLEGAKSYELSNEFLLQEHKWIPEDLELIRSEFTEQISQGFGSI